MEVVEQPVWVYEVEIVDPSTMDVKGFFPELYATINEARAAIVAERSMDVRLVRMVQATEMEMSA